MFITRNLRILLENISRIDHLGYTSSISHCKTGVAKCSNSCKPLTSEELVCVGAVSAPIRHPGLLRENLTNSNQTVASQKTSIPLCECAWKSVQQKGKFWSFHKGSYRAKASVWYPKVETLTLDALKRIATIMFHVHDQPVSIYFLLPHVWVDVFMSMIDGVQRQSLHAKYDLWISSKAKCVFLVKMLQGSHKLTKAMLKQNAASHCLTTPGGAFGLSAWHWLRQRSSFDVQALPELCRKPHPVATRKIEENWDKWKINF